MLSLTAHALWTYKRRLVGTVLAIALGVAFLSGTQLLGDTLSTNFDRLFAQADGSTDVLIRSATRISTDRRQTTRGSIDASLVSVVRRTSGVSGAEPYLEGYGQLLARDGKGIGGNGPPTRAANWITEPSLNPYRLVEGRAPKADNEVVINRGAAKTGHLHLGDTTTLLTPQPISVHIVGLSTFGTADGFGPSTFTGLTLHAAQQRLTNNPSQVTDVLVKAAPGVVPDDLATALRRVLPTSVQTLTGAALAAENINEINRGFLGFLRIALLVFAVVALLVAAFSIHNAFSILAAQRGRDTALLRALGATRRQVVTSTVWETVSVGLIGSAVGCVAGIGIAGLLKAMFDGFGFALPAGGLVFRPASLVLAVSAGTAATVVAGLSPALRASRVAPLAALREVAAETAAPSRVRLLVGGSVTALGIIIVMLGATGSLGIGLAALGGALTAGGVIALGPIAARPAAALLGAPVAALRGITGRLSRRNAMRNPRRTSATAAALMVGVSVVTLFTAVGASLKASSAHNVDRSLTADLVVTSTGVGGGYGGGRFSPQLATDIAAVPGVRASMGLGAGSALLNGDSHAVAIADPRMVPKVADLGATNGSLDGLSLGVSTHAARSHGWAVGTAVAVTYPDGSTSRVTVAAVYQRADIVGDYLLSRTAWTAHAPQPLDEMVLVGVRPNTRPVVASIAAVATRYGNPKVQTRSQFRNNAAAGVTTILGLIYVMLGLSIVIALLGIANTLSLSIHERTRELGMLRAVGQTRRQTRAMVRWESVIISVFGTIGGVTLGAFLGWALVNAASSSTFAVFAFPPAQVVVFLAVGAVAGVLAGVRPARRAARLDILSAIATT